MAIKIALDTNSYSNLCRGYESLIKLVEQAVAIALPVIVLAELKAGFKSGQLARQNAQQLAIFLDDSRVTILPIDEQTAEHYANFSAGLRRQRTPIPTDDIWIAALAAQYDYQLVSSDSHFDNLPELPRIKN